MASPVRADPVRLMPQSLQGRMLMLSAIATLVALALAGWAIAGVLERFVIQNLDRRLDAELSLLASAIGNDGTVDRGRIEQRIGAFEQGPGWRWRIEGPGGAIGSADFPSFDPPPPVPPDRPKAERGREDHEHIRPRDGHMEGGARTHARQLTIHTSRGDLVITAAAPRNVVSRPIRGALAPLLTAVAVLAIVLSGATFMQLRLGLRPVRRMRDEVAALRAGHQVRISEERPLELRPLAAELNALVRENAAALEASRQSAANLAHALKTPVATLALDVRDDPERSAQVARINATIRHHLGRARSAANRRASTPLEPIIKEIAAVVGRLHVERALAFAIEVDPHISVAVDPHDLDELVGNLVDNAAHHARSTIRIVATVALDNQRYIDLAISDDGPGIPAKQRGLMPQVGLRLDERGEGHGFGLSIVAELASLYGGSLILEESVDRGLLARITLPMGQ